MGRANIPFLSFNRGLLSPKALARVDLDRTRLSAEVFTNWIPSTQGSMSIRPGTRYLGSSLHDTGAEWIEFVASTDDVALLELTHGKMRVWLGDDAHALELLARPKVDTTASLSDTGWVNASTGGNAGVVTASDLIPAMTAATTNGVTITADAEDSASFAAWTAADNSLGTRWQKSGGVPTWLNVNFGSGNAKAVGAYTLTANPTADRLDNQPTAWRLLGSNFDTGTYATDTGKWTLEDERSAQTGWATGEKRTYRITDTGTPGPWRNWRLHITALNGDSEATMTEFELLTDTGSATPNQARFSSGQLTLNAGAIGSMARAEKRLIEVA